jgi:dihydroneopterin triphosphate diphosphatase
MNFNNNLIEVHIFKQTKKGIEFLLLKRSDKNIVYPGLWQMVNGKIKKGEKAYETALREMKEETGLDPIKLWTIPNINLFYTPESDSITILPVFAAKVKLNAKVTISNEHSDFQWLPPAKIKKQLAWPGQRKSVDLITRYFLSEGKIFNLLEITH